MQWFGIKLITVCKFHHASQIHNTYTVRNMFYHRKVVCDKQIGQTQLFLKLDQQVYYLCLNGYVQCRDWFITYNEFRFNCQRTRNTDTLSLSTGELMWKTKCMFLVQTYHFQKLVDSLATFFTFVQSMDINTFSDDIFNGHTRVKRRIWVLENNLGTFGKFFLFFFM